MAGSAIRSRFAGHANRSSKTRYALRLKTDHFIGADHKPLNSNEKMEAGRPGLRQPV